MPSLQHAAVALFARLVMRSGDIEDADRLRARFADLRKPVPQPGRGWERDETLLPVPVWTYGSGAPLLVLHGGAYTKEMSKEHFTLAANVADRTGRRVLMPQYRLAPEATWRDTVPMLTDFAATLDDLVLLGDSAGGGLALAIAQGLRDRGRGAERMVLISPWVDLTGSAPGIEEAAARDPWLRLDWLHLYAGWWAGSPADLTRPEVSPGRADLVGLPPTLTFQGTRDLLHAENLVLRDRAAEAGWHYEYVEAEGLIHVFPLLPIPEAKRAVERIVAFLGGR